MALDSFAPIDPLSKLFLTLRPILYVEDFSEPFKIICPD